MRFLKIKVMNLTQCLLNLILIIPVVFFEFRTFQNFHQNKADITVYTLFFFLQ